MKIRESHTNVAIRLFYGILYALAGMGVILLSPYGFGVLVLAIIIGGSLEFYSIGHRCGYKPYRFLGLAVSVSLFALNYDNLFFEGNCAVIFLAMALLAIPAIFVSELFTASKNPIANIGSTLLPMIYIALPSILLCNIALLLGGGKWSGAMMVAYLVITWANDSFAYLVGITFGRNIMFPRISPKKSWEGFVGGVVGALCFGVGFAHLFEQSYFVWGGMAIIAAVTGVLGDLVESMFKRSVALKDSGNIIPGHGGWLDRFDSFLISSPVVFVYLYILNVLGQI